VTSLEFSADGQKLLASTGTEARLLEAKTGKTIRALVGHAYQVMTASFSPDGRRAVTASQDKTARLWDVESGVEIRTFSGHTAGVNSAGISPDGRRIVTSSDDMTARVWDLDSGNTVAILSGHLGYAWDAAFDVDGHRVITASEDTTVRIWKVFPKTADLIGYAYHVAPRCLTREQRETSFVDPKPPSWCVEMEKWPYQTSGWRDWLRAKREGLDPPLPDGVKHGQ
jgi:WD40 repeat protein